MGTRSLIAKYDRDAGTVTYIYCHWDGYPTNNGKILQDNYKTVEQVDALLAEGDMSALEATPAQCTTYRQRGDSDVDAKVVNMSLSEWLESVTCGDDDGRKPSINCWQEWVYTFVDGNWICSDVYDGIHTTIPEAIAREEAAQ